MRDLEERLQGVDRIPVPDQWAAIERRTPKATAAPSELRVLVIVVVLMLFVAAIGGVFVAFQRSPLPSTQALPTPTTPGREQGPTIALSKSGSSLVATAGTSADDIWAVGETHGRTFPES